MKKKKGAEVYYTCREGGRETDLLTKAKGPSDNGLAFMEMLIAQCVRVKTGF